MAAEKERLREQREQLEAEAAHVREVLQNSAPGQGEEAPQGAPADTPGEHERSPGGTQAVETEPCIEWPNEAGGASSDWTAVPGTAVVESARVYGHEVVQGGARGIGSGFTETVRLVDWNTEADENRVLSADQVARILGRRRYRTESQ